MLKKRPFFASFFIKLSPFEEIATLIVLSVKLVVVVEVLTVVSSTSLSSTRFPARGQARDPVVYNRVSQGGEEEGKKLKRLLEPYRLRHDIFFFKN